MQIITAEQDLERFIRHALTQTRVSCDTEFVRVRTYYPELALIQMATEDEVVLVDPLGVKDFTSLKTLFENKEIVKIFHAPRQDLELMRHALGIKPYNTFDTQVAATMVGLPDQVGYEAMTRELLEIQLDKSAQFTDWLIRPLSPEQLSYAAADVTHLLEIYKLFEARLDEKMEWVRDLCASYDEDSLYAIDLTPAFLKWATRLKSNDHRARLWIAMQWREARAQKINRPRAWILKDADMLAIAKAETEDMPPGLAKSLKTDMPQALEAVAEILKTSAKPLTSKQKEAYEAVKTKLAFIGAEHALPPRYLASKGEIESFIRSGEKPKDNSEWKNRLFWDTLEESCCASS